MKLLERFGIALAWLSTGGSVRQRKMIAALVTSVVILGGLVGSAAAGTTNLVLDGVTVGGIPVAGLSARQLAARLSPAAEAMSNRPMKLVVADRSWIRSPADLGITVDLKKSIERAMMAGRKNILSWMFHSLSSPTEKLGWEARVDEKRFLAAVKELGELVKVEASNGNIVLEGARVIVRPPSQGFTLVGSAARKALLESSLRPRRNDKVALPVTITSPEIGEKETARVEQQAKSILAAPVQFSYQSRAFSLSPERIAAALRVGVVDDPEDPGKDQTLSLQVDPGALREQIIAGAPFVLKPAKNASFSVVGGKVKLNPSADGSTVETAAAAYQIMNLSGQRPPIALPLRPLPAEFTTEMAQGLGIRSKISTFTTPFDSQNAPRVANIDRMASVIDGKVLRPGDSFSLNSVTGSRTPENGYQEAQVIVDGELVPGIGGGVCQVATTLFNSVFTAGLDILERSNHSLHISKYPMGKDATVSFGQQDLRFRNDTQFGILLKASVSAKAMSVDIYSSPLGRTIEESISQPRNPKAPSTKYVDDPTLPAGQEVVSEEGKPGFDVTVTRKVLADGKVVHSDTFVSHYKAWKRIIRKGTGPPKPAEPPPPAAGTPPPVSPPPGATVPPPPNS